MMEQVWGAANQGLRDGQKPHLRVLECHAEEFGLYFDG